MDPIEAITWSVALAEGVQEVTDVLPLFLQSPAIYFIGLAFVGACVGVARKLIPMRRR